MKKLFIALLIAPLLFSSCNKKLKKEIDELEKDVQEQKEKNANLQTQIDGVNSLLGSNEPMTVVTTFKDDNSVTRNVSATYSFKSTNSSTQYMQENSNGTYSIGIERFLDLDWNESASIEFDYNPNTGAISASTLRHYWDWNITGYDSYVYYTPSYDPDPTINIIIRNINLNTGEIDLTATGSVVDGYNGPTPNPTMACSTTLSFKGVCGVLRLSFQ